jgi:fatty-acid desaturase
VPCLLKKIALEVLRPLVERLYVSRQDRIALIMDISLVQVIPNQVSQWWRLLVVIVGLNYATMVGVFIGYHSPRGA